LFIYSSFKKYVWSVAEPVCFKPALDFPSQIDMLELLSGENRRMLTGASDSGWKYPVI